jgi:signal transduction histidine kinase
MPNDLAFPPTQPQERMSETIAPQHVVEAPSDPAFARIAALAAHLLRVPAVLISVIDGGRIRLKSCHGCTSPMLQQAADLCALAHLDDTPWVVRNTLHDARMASHSLVTGAFGLRFIACVPLRMSGGEHIGSLCVLDQRARALPRRDIETLHTLAAIAVDQFAMLRATEDGGAASPEWQATELHRRMMRSQTTMRRVAMTLQTVREEERKRIARELHDDLGQLLATLRMDLSRLQQRRTADAATAETLAKMDELLVASIDSLRRIAANLRPKALDEGGLYFALQSLLENFSARHGVRYQLHAREEDLVLNDAYGTAVFRIAQESLTNISRHACATQVDITIARQAHALAIRIQDNGRGIRRRDLAKQNSFGLLGMRERVKAMGGRITVSGLHRQGTCVAIVLPLPNA